MRNLLLLLSFAFITHNAFAQVKTYEEAGLSYEQATYFCEIITGKLVESDYYKTEKSSKEYGCYLYNCEGWSETAYKNAKESGEYNLDGVAVRYRICFDIQELVEKSKDDRIQKAKTKAERDRLEREAGRLYLEQNPNWRPGTQIVIGTTGNPDGPGTNSHVYTTTGTGVDDDLVYTSQKKRYSFNGAEVPYDHYCYTSKKCKPGKEERQKCQKCLSDPRWKKVSVSTTTTSSGNPSTSGTGKYRQHEQTDYDPDRGGKGGRGRYDDDYYDRRSDRDYRGRDYDDWKKRRNSNCDLYGIGCFDERDTDYLNRRYHSNAGAAGTCLTGFCQQSKTAQIMNGAGNILLGAGTFLGPLFSSNNMRRAVEAQSNAYMHNSNNALTASIYANDTRLAGYKAGLNACIGHREGYWDRLTEQEYGLPEWTEPECNGYGIDQFAGYNGYYNGNLGLYNPILGQGFTGGFASTALSPWFNSGLNGNFGNPSCMCISAPCNCGSIGGGVNNFFGPQWGNQGWGNAGLNFNAGLNVNPFMNYGSTGAFNPNFYGNSGGAFWNGGANFNAGINTGGNQFWNNGGVGNPYAGQSYMIDQQMNMNALQNQQMGMWGQQSYGPFFGVP